LILYVDGTLQAITNTTTNFEENWPQLPPLVSYGNSEDNNRYLQYQSFLHANQATNIVIQGKGTIDAQGAWWWDAFHHRSSTLPAGRPNLLQFVNCTNIEITGVTMQDSPFWTIHPVYCTNVHIHHMKIRSPLYAPNVDGIDPDSSKNVLIESNDISCGDDHIAIKAGRCGDGKTMIDSIDCMKDDNFRLGAYTTSNVTIRYNTFRTGMGIALGSELSGGIENVQVYQNIIGLCDHGHDSPETSCGWGHAIHLKTSLTRGGFLRNLQFHTNIIYNTTGFLLLETDYQDNQHKLPPNYPTTELRNISIRSNSGLGLAVSMNFGCSEFMQCDQIQVIDNWILDGTSSNYHCSYVDTYQVENNFPSGLEECMYDSMNRSEAVLPLTDFRSMA
jgi:polygalacturonase